MGNPWSPDSQIQCGSCGKLFCREDWYGNGRLWLRQEVYKKGGDRFAILEIYRCPHCDRLVELERDIPGMVGGKWVNDNQGKGE